MDCTMKRSVSLSTGENLQQTGNFFEI